MFVLNHVTSLILYNNVMFELSGCEESTTVVGLIVNKSIVSDWESSSSAIWAKELWDITVVDGNLLPLAIILN